MTDPTPDTAATDDRLGLDSYSLHLRLDGNGKLSPARLETFFDEVVELGLDGCQLDPAHIDYESPSGLDAIGRMARDRRLYVECGMGGTQPDRLVGRLQAARRVGARVVRTFVGFDRSTWEDRLDELRPMVIEHLRAGAAEAATLGIPLAVENHGDLTATELRDILEAVGSPWIGACVDFGNNLGFGEDPLETIRVLAPFAEAVHVKDVVDHDGTPRSCLLGDGRVDLPAAIDCVRREGRSRCPWTLETPYEEGGGPDPVAAEAEFVRENVCRLRRLLTETAAEPAGRT